MVFGPDYSSIYDSLYANRDVKNDIKAFTHIITDYGMSKCSVLDVGCGTGTHAAELKEEHDVVGVDLSESMLAIARQKVPNVQFHQGDAKDFRLDRKFDVAAMFFAVLGYQHTNEAVLDTLKNIRSHLNDNGLFIFDVWHGPTVLIEKPNAKVKKINLGDIELIRLVEPVLDEENNRVVCNYLWWLCRGGQIISKSETHLMRYFFPMEMKLFLKLAGFKLLRIGQPGTVYRGIEKGCWQAMYVCQAI
jgi:SAM-dependent methyltransferase